MAARLRPRHQDEIREKIRASQLVNRLEGHVFGETDMTSTQVTAALGLLKKCVPDISESKTEHDVGGNLYDILASFGRAEIEPTTDGDPPVA